MGIVSTTQGLLRVLTDVCVCSGGVGDDSWERPRMRFGVCTSPGGGDCEVRIVVPTCSAICSERCKSRANQKIELDRIGSAGRGVLYVSYASGQKGKERVDARSIMQTMK